MFPAFCPLHSLQLQSVQGMAAQPCETGPCYWEVELSGDFSLTVTYKNVTTTQGESESLGRYTVLTFIHNKKINQFVSSPSRVAVYLGHRAGFLSSIKLGLSPTKSRPLSFSLSMSEICEVTTLTSSFFSLPSMYCSALFCLFSHATHFLSIYFSLFRKRKMI